MAHDIATAGQSGRSRDMQRPTHPAAPRQTPSFHELLLASLPVLRQRALALTRHKADAEDLLQTAVANALAAHESFEIGTDFRAWMTRILRNRFLSNLRSKRETVDIDDAPQSVLGRDGGQENGLATLELNRCLALLPADQRLLLLMITVQGVSYREASEQLSVAVGTLKCRIFRVRRQLRTLMLGENDVAVSAGHARGAPMVELSLSTASSIRAER